MNRRWFHKLAALFTCAGMTALLASEGLALPAGDRASTVLDTNSADNLPGQAAFPRMRERAGIDGYPSRVGNGGAGLQEEGDDSELLRMLDEVSKEEETAPGETPAKTEKPANAEAPLGKLPPLEPVPPAESGGIGTPSRTAAEPKAPAPRTPVRTPRTAPAPASGAAAGGGNIFEDLGLTKQAQQEESKFLSKQAQDLVHDGDLVRAEGRLERAIQLDPSNEDAKLLLSEVRMLLGDASEELPGVSRWIGEEVEVARQQTAAQVQRMIHEGARLREEGSFTQAIEMFERAIDSIHNFPFNLDLDATLKQAESLLASTREQEKTAKEAERIRFLKMVAETRASQDEGDQRYVKNQVRILTRKAQAAEEEKKYDRAITLYQRIQQLQPEDEQIRRKIVELKRTRHMQKMADLIQLAVRNYEIAIVGIEESSVVYQQIFRYPELREWRRLSAKSISIEEEIASQETAWEKALKRKLEEKYEIGFEEGVPLKDALAALQGVSGVNFVLNKDAADSADTEVKLPRFPDVPLRSVLTLVLEAANPDLAFTLKEGAVLIGPKDSVKDKEYLRFYEVSDLIRIPPDFPAPRVALNELQGKQEEGGALPLEAGMEEKVTTKWDTESFLELVQKELGDGGEPAEGISFMKGKLSVRAPLQKHLTLAKLLKHLRKSTGMLVTVESRFLDIQDNYLEEIGIDFGSANSTFLPNSIPDIDGAGTSVAPGYEYIDPTGDMNLRIANISTLSQPLGSKVNPFNLTASGGGAFQLNVLNAERYQIEAILTSVAKTQEIRQLNSPRVTAFNGQTAHTLVVNQMAYIQDLEVNQTGVIPVINPVIDVLNSGSILEVRPTIAYNQRYVILEIQPTLAEKLDSDIAILNLSGNFTVVPVELPVLSVTKIKTTVTVPDGGTVLVGGLKREVSKKEQIGIPGFLDLPILSLLSGRKGMSKLRSNLFVLINCKITIVREEEARLFGT